MNSNQIKSRIAELSKIICNQGVVTPANKAELRKLDARASELQDEPSDGQWFLALFEMREEIAALLNSDAAVFA